MEAARIPTEAVSAEIVPLRQQPEGSPAIVDRLDELEAWIPAAVEARATEQLAQLASQAEVVALLQRRQGYGALANRCSSLKLRAEAGIGAIDMDRCPKRSDMRANPLEVGMGKPVNVAERLRWRQLAIAEERGLLEPTLLRLSADVDHKVTSVIATQALNEIGAAWVPAKVVKQAFERSGLSLRQLAIQTGRCSKGSGNLSTTLRGHTMHYASARDIFLALGLDPKKLPPLGNHSMKRARQRSAKRRRAQLLFVRRERKPTGSRWDKCYVEFRKCLTTFGQLAPDQDVIWDEAYVHFKAIEDLLGKQMQRDRQR